MNSEEIIQLSSEGDACIRALVLDSLKFFNSYRDSIMSSSSSASSLGIQRLLVEKKNFLEHLFELRKITSKLTQLSGQLQTNAKNNDSVVAETEESSLSLLRKRKEQLEQVFVARDFPSCKDFIVGLLIDRNCTEKIVFFEH